jgi:hypothetical protein
MESRLSLGTVVGVFLAIAFGVYCLHASATAHHRRDELHGGLTHRSRFVDARNHIHRNRILDQLKSDICQSGTYVRDFLPEPEPGHADLHKQEFDGARERVQAMLNEYTGIPLRRSERRFGSSAAS